MAKDILSVGGFTIIKRIAVLSQTLRSTWQPMTRMATAPSLIKRLTWEKPEDHRFFEQTEMEYQVAQKIDHPYVRKCFKAAKSAACSAFASCSFPWSISEGKTTRGKHDAELGRRPPGLPHGGHRLNAMHQQDYVHCDMKPNNILISKAGTIKIIDLDPKLARSGPSSPESRAPPTYNA